MTNPTSEETLCHPRPDNQVMQSTKTPGAKSEKETNLNIAKVGGRACD